VAIVAFLVAGVRSGPVRWGDLLTSAVWDQRSGRFGGAAMLWGTAAVAGIAMAIAAPLGWAAAIAISEVAPARWSRLLRTGCELLAVVPSIVYGLVGIAFIRPLVSHLTGVPGGDSLLTGGLVLAVMVLPTVVAVSVDALRSVPNSTREAAAACGLTRVEVTTAAVLPVARRGMGAGALLGLARALGETIAVFLLVGRADSILPRSPGEALSALVHPGQTLTTKLNGPETVLAGTSGAHWAALCALGLLLLSTVAALTVVGERRTGGRRWLRLLPARTNRRHSGIHPTLPWRFLRDRAGRAASLVALALPVTIVTGLVCAVAWKGRSGLDPSFWWETAVGASAGGIRDQLLGTVLLVTVAGLMAAPVGLALGLVIAEYAPPRLARCLRTLTLTLGGVPSILLGLWGLWLFSTRAGWGKSWLAGAIVLAVVAVPAVVVAVAAAAEALPAGRREAALAAGLRRDQVVRSVVVPQALPGLVTGLLLGLARAAGETAPLLFCATVFSGAEPFPEGIADSPVVALPTHIFNLAQDAADPAARRAAWGTALVHNHVACVLALLGSRRRTHDRTHGWKH
jgi:phosphate transport system permease protein